MTQFFECGLGHRWQMETRSREAPIGSVPCPECGAQGTALFLTPNGEPFGTITLTPGSKPSGEVHSEDAARPLPSIPGYEVLGELGRGGMGIVYKARQLSLNRLVAVKMVLAGAQAASTDLVRFLSEAEAVAQLQHPNIVQIHEIGKHAGLPFLSLEYVDGGTLSQQIKGTPQLPREAARLIEALARAVHFAHEHGIVHRDLKPGNILLTKDERTGDSSFVPKITDFGLAKRGQGSVGMTQTGAILGTPSYMAPEQAEGKKDLGPPADTYALGAILYELLTGRPPFQAPTQIDTVLQVIGKEPVPPHQLQPKVPRDLETICLKCLQKDPRKRYASSEALADDLARFLENQPIVARPVGRLERSWRWCRRNPVVASLAAAVVVCVLVAGVLLNQERTNTISNLHRAEGAERERTEQLARSFLEQARARRFSKQPGQRFDSLSALKEAAKLARDLDLGEAMMDNLRNETIASLALADLRMVSTNLPYPEEKAVFAFDPTYTLYARTKELGQISIRNVQDDKEINRPLLILGEPVPVWLKFSPDGRYLAWAGSSGRIFFVESASQKQRPRYLASGWGVNFSPDSRLIAISQGKEVIIFDLGSGKRLSSIRTGLENQNLAFSPNGKQIAVVPHYSDVVQIYDLETKALLQQINLPGFQAESGPVWHPDGERIAVGGGDGRTLIVNVITNKTVAVLVGHVQNVTRVEFSRTGAVVITQSWDNTTRLWNTATGEMLLSRVGHFYLSPGRDGKILGTAADSQERLHFVELAEGLEYQSLATSLGAGQGYLRCGTVSPDGQLVAAGMDDGVRLFNLVSGRELAFLATGQCQSCFFGPGGDVLFTCGINGLNRWPLRSAGNDLHRKIIGPPKSIRLPVGVRCKTAWPSQDGKTAVVGNEASWQSLLLNLETEAFQPFLLDHASGADVAMSPDGKWAATSGWHSSTQCVWDARTGRRVAELKVGAAGRPFFTPDSAYFVTSVSGEYCFREVNTLEPVRRLKWDQQGVYAGSLAFSGDGKLMALPLSPGIIDLMDWKANKTLARLEHPAHDQTDTLCFNSNGTRLVAMDPRAYALRVWDLRLLREELAEMGLDWDADPPPANQDTPGPSEIRVEWGNQDPVASGFVVPLPMAGKWRQANPEELAGWIEELRNADATRRAAAADALAEVGPAARKILTEAIAVKDGGIKKEAEIILERIDAAEALLPRRFSLKFNETPLEEALQSLGRVSGLTLQYDFPKSFFNRKKVVTLELDNQTAWEALDRICRAAKLKYYASYGGIVRVIEGQSVPENAVVYLGLLRLRVSSGTFSRILDLVDSQRSQESVSLALHLQWPLLNPISNIQTAPELLEATGEAGESLLYKNHYNGGTVQVDRLQSEMNLQVNLIAPGSRGTKLKRLRGLLRFDVPTRRQDLIMVPDLAKSQVQTFGGEEGHHLTLHQVKKIGDKWYQLEVAVTGPTGWNYDFNASAFELTDANGNTFPMGYGYLQPRATRRPLPGEIALLAAVPQAGSLAQLPWTALAANRIGSDPREFTGQLNANIYSPLKEPVKLTFYRYKLVPAKVPFEFHDLPLP